MADAANGKGSSQKEEELRQEVQRLRQELAELTSSSRTVSASASSGGSATAEILAPEKHGYLFKWQDRSIGWGGTKWGLRFVRLDHGQLSYFKSHEEKSPRYILTLKDCAVRDEGSKVNKRHSTSTTSTGKKTPSNSSGSAGAPNSPSALKLKSSESFDSTDEQNQHHEVGSRFYVFSIYQRPSPSKTTTTTNPDEKEQQEGVEDDDDEIIPLLRFSTQSYAEKLQWIDLISQSCAYCDTDEFALRQHQKDQGTLLPSSSSTARLQQQNRSKRGTLPKLVFETPQLISRHPSGYNLKNKKDFQSKSTSKDAARSHTISYPPSKPMHRQASPSYLSPEGSDSQNYRGLFNLLLIILVVSNFRLLLDTVLKHGFIWDKLAKLKGFSLDEDPLQHFPFVSGLLLVQAFIVGGYCIEKMLAMHLLGNGFGMFLHFVNTNACLGVVMVIVWYLIDHPLVGAVLVMQATITWLKLFSYAHANYDYRSTSLDKHKATLALIKDLDEEGIEVAYPTNVTLGNIYYFWLAPTLTYQIAFPRAPFIRWYKVVWLLIHLFISATLLGFFAAQVVAPTLDSLVKDLEANRGEVRINVIGDYLLKLSITSTYIWLLGFYGFFHCFLNLTAELLRFGDRVFYRDWWNASEVSAYWRLWNMPVHYFLVRHVYFPSVRIGLSKTGATFVVFFFSAIVHELLISVPCHMIRIHSFMAMMGQIPLIFLTKLIDKKYRGSSIGNIIFWISFCFVGQPMALLLYTMDYWESNHHEDLLAVELDETPKFKIPFAAIGKIFGAPSEL